MLAYGATFELTPREKGMNGAIARATELVATTPGAWMPQQFENPANVDVHVRTTAQEIAADFPSGIDALITGVGTGGHITGCARVLKPMWPKLKVFAVEPSASPGHQRRQAEPAPDPGHRRGLHPEDPRHRAARRHDPRRRPRRRGDGAPLRAREEGMLVGISSGATLAAIAQKLPDIAPGSTRARLQLRHRRALPVDRRLSSGVKPQILIVEDEPGIADTLQYALRTDGFEPAWCATGEEALARIAAAAPALVILDVGLPDASGFEVFKRIRATSDVPVVFLTARSDEIDRVVGLELGADDYVAKPFSPRELVARVRGVLRRTGKGAGAAAGRRAGAAAADRRRRRADADPLPRPPARALALRVRPAQDARLAAGPRVLARHAARARLGNDTESMDRTVDAHVKTVRAKMKAIAPGEEPIRTHRGSGYSLAEDLPPDAAEDLMKHFRLARHALCLAARHLIPAIDGAVEPPPARSPAR